MATVYPMFGQDEIDHGRSPVDSNESNIVSPFDHEESNNRPASQIVPCTEACTLDNQNIVFCDGQRIPGQLLTLHVTTNNDAQESQSPLPTIDDAQEPQLPVPTNNDAQELQSPISTTNDDQEVQLPRLSSQIEHIPPPEAIDAVETPRETPSSPLPSNSIVGEFLTIICEAMKEDDCLRSMMKTSKRTVDQILCRMYQHYLRGSIRNAIMEWFWLLGISVESGLHLSEGNLVLPAFDLSSVVQSVCDNPDCPSPEERYSHVNIVLQRRTRDCDRQHTLQNLIDHWFDSRETCNAIYRSDNPENFNATHSGSETCRMTTCDGTRCRNRLMSSYGGPPLVLPINIHGMQFSGSDEMPMHINFGGTRFRLAGVTFVAQEDGVTRATSRIFGARRSFYHSGNSASSEISQEDPTNGVLSFVYYVRDTGV